MTINVELASATTTQLDRIQAGKPFTFPGSEDIWIRIDDENGPLGVPIVQLWNGHKEWVAFDAAVILQPGVAVTGKLIR